MDARNLFKLNADGDKLLYTSSRIYTWHGFSH
jgi:hypothetical protein